MKKTIVILHGWNVSDYYTKLTEFLKKKGHIVYVPILPGFKNVPLVTESMTLDDYVLFVKTFCKKNNIDKMVLIGHSFGGRVACKFTSLYPQYVETLILTGAPLIKHSLTLKKSFFYFLAKTGKTLTWFFPRSLSDLLRKFLYKGVGEWDYYKADKLRGTFKNILKEDLSPLLASMKTKTILIWGEYDKAVPIEDAQSIASLLPHATLHIVAHASHKLPYEEPKKFFQLTEKYL